MITMVSPMDRFLQTTSTFQPLGISYMTDLTLEDTSNTTSEPLEYIESLVARRLFQIISPMLLLLGLVGNILVLLVLGCKRPRQSTTLFYISTLAFTDLCVLYTGLLRYWIRAVWDVDIRDLSHWGCKIQLFLLYLTMDMSSWILVCVSLERFLGVYFPLKSRDWCTIKRARILLVIVFICLTGINIHFFWTNGLNKDAECGSMTEAYFLFDEYVFVWIDFTVLSIIPFFIMLVCNCFIIRSLLKLRTRHKLMSAGLTSFKEPPVKVSSTTKMLLVVSIVFLATTLPMSVYLITETFYLQHSSPHLDAQLDLARAVCSLIQYSNYATNFYLYCLRAKQFRQALHSLLRHRSKRSVQTPGSQEYLTQMVTMTNDCRRDSSEENEMSCLKPSPNDCNSSPV